MITPPEVVTVMILPPGASPAAAGYVDVGCSSTVVPPIPNEGSRPPEPAMATPTPSPVTRAHATAAPQRAMRRRLADSTVRAARVNTG